MESNILDKLSWSMPISVQREAMSQILSIDDFDWRSLILPYGKKDCWQNCAAVLARLPDETISLLAHDLMGWFQDANWLGADIIAARLKSLPPEMLNDAVRAAKRRAGETNDPEWLYHIACCFGSK